MFEIIIGILSGRQSDSIATEIALKKGRDKPTLQDRCHAAIATIFPILLLGVIAMTAVYPTMHKLWGSFIDWGSRSFLNYSFQLFLLIILACLSVPLRLLLHRLPFSLLTAMFIILVSTFAMLMVYGFTHI